jgi:hypothetical protein
MQKPKWMQPAISEPRKFPHDFITIQPGSIGDSKKSNNPCACVIELERLYQLTSLTADTFSDKIG